MVDLYDSLIVDTNYSVYYNGFLIECYVIEVTIYRKLKDIVDGWWYHSSLIKIIYYWSLYINKSLIAIS